MPEETLVKQALDMLTVLGPGQSEWLGTVKFYLERVGLTCHFLNTELVSDSRFKKIISSRLKYSFVELWHSYIFNTTSSKMRFYKLIKNSFGKEPYLDNVPIYHLRKVITKFRCSDHNL